MPNFNKLVKRILYHNSLEIHAQNINKLHKKIMGNCIHRYKIKHQSIKRLKIIEIEINHKYF